jgi:hypothetical protein
MKREIPLAKDTIACVNPLWEIEIQDYKGNQVVKMPFMFFILTYLKDYGFQPEEKLMNPSGSCVLTIATDEKGNPATCRLPLYIKGRG